MLTCANGVHLRGCTRERAFRILINVNRNSCVSFPAERYRVGEIVLRLCRSRPNDFSIDEILLASTSEINNTPLGRNAHSAKIFNEVCASGKSYLMRRKHSFLSRRYNINISISWFCNNIGSYLALGSILNDRAQLSSFIRWKSFETIRNSLHC